MTHIHRNARKTVWTKQGRSGVSPAQLRRFPLSPHDLGTEHLVFDLRFKFDRWFDQIELLGKEVISRFRS
jgi:hypothetical protein